MQKSILFGKFSRILTLRKVTPKMANTNSAIAQTTAALITDGKDMNSASTTNLSSGLRLTIRKGRNTRSNLINLKADPPVMFSMSITEAPTQAKSKMFQ